MNLRKSLKSGFAWAALSAAFCAGLPAAASAEDVEFTIINRTGSSLTGFYVTHSKANDWGGNLVPDGSVLPSGNKVGVTINDGRSTCLYDIRAEFQDGGDLEDFEINVCELDSYTFE